MLWKSGTFTAQKVERLVECRIYDEDYQCFELWPFISETSSKRRMTTGLGFILKGVMWQKLTSEMWEIKTNINDLATTRKSLPIFNSNQ